MHITISITKLRDGNTAELEKLYNSYFSRFLSFAYRYIKSEDICRDIVQEAFIAFWERREGFEHLAPIEAFFYQTIRNKSLNYIRDHITDKEYSIEEVSHLESEDFMEKSIIREEVNAMIRQEIEQLAPQTKKVILLSLQDKSNQEIADVLKISINTVKVHKARAYAKLRIRLTNLFNILFILGLS